MTSRMRHMQNMVADCSAMLLPVPRSVHICSSAARRRSGQQRVVPHQRQRSGDDSSLNVAVLRARDGVGLATASLAICENGRVDALQRAEYNICGYDGMYLPLRSSANTSSIARIQELCSVCANVGAISRE